MRFMLIMFLKYMMMVVEVVFGIVKVFVIAVNVRSVDFLMNEFGVVFMFFFKLWRIWRFDVSWVLIIVFVWSNVVLLLCFWFLGCLFFGGVILSKILLETIVDVVSYNVLWMCGDLWCVVFNVVCVSVWVFFNVLLFLVKFFVVLKILNM